MWAWAYARTDNNGFDIISDGPIDGGEFTLKLPSGDYKVGLWIGPESGYTMSAEADADVSASGDESTSTVSITVGANDKKISGSLVDSSGNAITGVEGDVFAVKGGAFGSTWIGTTINEQTGAYSLALTAGVWDLSYYLEVDDDSDYMRSPTVSYRGGSFLCQFSYTESHSEHVRWQYCRNGGAASVCRWRGPE